MCRNYRKKLGASSTLAAGLQHNEVRRHQQNHFQSIHMRNCATVTETDVVVYGLIGSFQSRDRFFCEIRMVV